MANTAEQDLADSYRHSNPTRYANWTNEEILGFKKAGAFADPKYDEKYRMLSEPDVPEEADGEDAYMKQHPEARMAERMAKPGQWFQQNVLAPTVSAIDEAVGPTPIGDAMSGMGLSRMWNEHARGVASAEDRWIAQGKDITNLPIVGQVHNPLHALNRDIHEAMVDFNPFPESTGGAIVGAAMLGAIEIPTKLGEMVKATTPEAVEAGFGKLSKVIPGADKVFKDLARAKEDQVMSDHVTGLAMDAARERDARALAGLSLDIQRGEGTNEMNKQAEMTSHRILMGSEYTVPQLPQIEVGQTVQLAVNPANKLSNMYFDKVPLVKETNTIREKLAEHEVPLADVNEKLGDIKSELMGIVNTPAENSVASVLNKYLNKKAFYEERKGASYQPVVVTADILDKDAATLQSMGKNRLRSDAPGAKEAGVALLKASEEIKNLIMDKVPEGLAKRVDNNNQSWYKWYSTYDNGFIRLVRNPPFSEAFDPIFHSPESVMAYRAAVDEHEFQYAVKNKVNELIGKLSGADDPKAALAQLRKERPGWLESFLNENQNTHLDSLMAHKAEVRQGVKDVEGLYKKREEVEDRSRRASDKDNLDPTIRREDKIPKGTMLDNSDRTKILLGTALSAPGWLGVLGHFSPEVATTVGVVSAAGFGPELLSRLYLTSPEVRSMILDAGSAKDHVEAVKKAAQLATFLEAKSDEKRSYEEQPVKEGQAKKPMPHSLKKFEHPKEEPILLPSDVKPYVPGAPEEEPLQGQDPLDAGETYQWPVSAH